MAFLDYDGLSRFWGKVKDYIASNSGGRGNAKIFVGTCDTTASTAAKVVTCPDYDQLVVGDKIYVTFTNANTAHQSSLTLNVNGTGAKSIRIKGGSLTGSPYLNTLQQSSDIGSNSECLFTYDGTYWILSATTAVYARNLTTDSTLRPLIVGESRNMNSGYYSKILYSTPEVYLLNGELYTNSGKVLSKNSNALRTYIGKVDAADIMHDQYLRDLSSVNHYRAVLRIFFVSPEGYIYRKDQDSTCGLLDNHTYRLTIKAYNSSNTVVETYYDTRLDWTPWRWYASWDNDYIDTEYWLEYAFQFDSSNSNIDHISVSLTGFDSNLYMYNSSQNLNFNCHPSNHNTVEIKNVGLVYKWPDLNPEETDCFTKTGFALPAETSNVPQVWANDLENALLVRGYSFLMQSLDDDSSHGCADWFSFEDYNPYTDNVLRVLSNAFVMYKNSLYYTNGYFLVPISEGSVKSDQGVANAGKFLVVNSSGVVEPVSMTSWQGGSY